MIRKGTQLAATVMLLGMTLAGAQQLDDAHWTIETLMGRMAEIERAQVQFTETRDIALFSTAMVLTGTLVYERPATLERTVLTPYVARFTVDGDTLVIDTGARTEVHAQTLSNQPLVQALVESIRATLAGDRATLARFYHLYLEGNRMEWMLKLKPADTELATYVSMVKISGTDNRIDLIEVTETSGDRSITTITDYGGATQ